MATLLADSARACAAGYVVAHAMQSSERVPIELRKEDLKLALFVTSWFGTGVQIASHDIRANIDQLETANLCAGSEKRNIDYVRYLTERMPVSSESLE